jgi:hypothetical protein
MHQSLIIKHLFQVNALEDVSRERLETFVEDHPSFGIGHYLLSRKLQKEDPGRFEAKTQLTCLYFSNPFWLQWLLENTDVGGQKAAPEAMVFAPLPIEAPMPDHSVAETPVRYTEAPASVHEETAAFVQEEATAVIHEEPTAALHEASPAVIHEEAAAPDVHHAEMPVADLPTEEMPHVENVVTMAEEAFHEESAAAPTIAVRSGEEESRSAAEQLLLSIEKAREIRDSLQKLNTHFGDEGTVNGEELSAAAEAGVAVAEPIASIAEPIAVDEPVRVHNETPIRDEEVPFVLDETEETRIVAQAPAPQPIEATHERVTHEPVAGEPVAQQPVTVAAEPVIVPNIVFEPLHTIDYFASQGIKFTLEDNPADALGKQLKSFTDWLKTMRRLPQKNKEVIPDRLAEQAIQNFAAHSIEGKEVLTEAMAEVLAKQGMKQRARTVYEKLSLLNPEKSAYFAAKIEQLNIL